MLMTNHRIFKTQTHKHIAIAYLQDETLLQEEFIMGIWH